MSLVSNCCGASDAYDCEACSFREEPIDFYSNQNEFNLVPLITSLSDIDYSLIDSVDFDFDSEDYPDFCDTFIISADYNGREMTDSELDILNEDIDFVQEQLREFLF